MSSSTTTASARGSTGRVSAPEGFLPAVTEHLRSYVYLLVDPRSDRIFAVGSGVGDACFGHLADARTSREHPDHDRVREIEAAGKRVRVEVLRHGLDATTAAIVRTAVGETLDVGPRPEAQSQSGRVSVGELNARYGAPPASIDPAHPVVLVRIPSAFRRGTDHQRYEMTRGWWRAGARRERAQWAFAVDDGVVRAVYRIDGWEPARAGNRWGFRGHRDLEMEQHYLHHDVSEYLSADSPLSLRYVNC